MEHIRQYDWCALQPDTQYFVTESELDNCVTEKILQNKFSNPLISSDSEEEGKGSKIDWNLVFKRRNNEQNCHRIFVPGLRPAPAFTRLSALSPHQHSQGLRVLCATHPRILEDEFMARPTKLDLQAFQDFKEKYLKEQQEFINWAKQLWINGQCIRALRPKPVIESVYEAEFKVRANQMSGYPKLFEMVAQLPLESTGEFEMTMEKELIGVNISELPHAQCPQKIRSRLSVLRGGAAPEPCERHPVRFVLPNESSVSVLPITEVFRSLAQYAADHDAQFVASEGALRCLVQRRAWTLPVAVHPVVQPDGESTNVVVLGSEFMNKQENVLNRTFRALRHLLEVALVPASELAKRAREMSRERETAPEAHRETTLDDSSDEEDHLFIDFDEQAQNDTNDSDMEVLSIHSEKEAEMEIETNNSNNTEIKESPKTSDNYKSVFDGFGVYRCTCQDSVFERPPPRSFRKWRFKSRSRDHYDVIVHCAHKFKGSSGEVLLEPIPEYQCDMGASKQSDDRLASLALSLALRDSRTSVINVRLDAQSGDVIAGEECTRERWHEACGARGDAGAGAGALHTLLGQLQGLVPGNYVLQHEPNHGKNALLYAPRNTGAEQKLRLEFDSSPPTEADEASVKTPPQLTPTLLPWHKFRKILPCAFTHYPNQLAKPKKQAARKKTPPRALKKNEEKGGHQKKWPKKRGCRKKVD